jgi:hypothetical protein
MKNLVLIILFIVIQSREKSFAQHQRDSLTINFPLFISSALDGRMKEALRTLDNGPDSLLIRRHLVIKNELIKRFGYEEDIGTYHIIHKSPVDSLLSIYKSYWRRSLLGFNDIYDDSLKEDLINLFEIKNVKLGNDSLVDTKIEFALKKHIKSKGLYSTGFSRTGKYYDLLVWKSEKDTIYKFKLNNEKIECPVVFMEDFVSLGWQEYATADKIHPGGWATKNSLYCVKKSYDLNSESFLISYLAHEGRHFKDYSDFPRLSNPDLEYRAKLTELSMAKSTIFSLLYFFIANSNFESDDGHLLSNYFVIRDLSQKIFKKKFQNNIEEWKKINPDVIRKISYSLLMENGIFLVKNNKYVIN